MYFCFSCTLYYHLVYEKCYLNKIWLTEHCFGWTVLSFIFDKRSISTTLHRVLQNKNRRRVFQKQNKKRIGFMPQFQESVLQIPQPPELQQAMEGRHLNKKPCVIQYAAEKIQVFLLCLDLSVEHSCVWLYGHISRLMRLSYKMIYSSEGDWVEREETGLYLPYTDSIYRHVWASFFICLGNKTIFQALDRDGFQDTML